MLCNPGVGGGFSLQVGYQGALEANLGVRQAMEDFLVVEPDVLGDGRFAAFVVLDGHGGGEVARRVKENFPRLFASALARGGGLGASVRLAVDMTSRMIESGGARSVGSTFCGLFVDRAAGELVSANLGDSRLLRAWPGTFLTSEHKVSDPAEAARLRATGGKVLNGRVGGTLIVSRALGDLEARAFGLIAEPEILLLPPVKGLYAVASDGLWDRIDPPTFDRLAALYAGRSLAELATALVTAAVAAGSNDNIALVLVNLQ